VDSNGTKRIGRRALLAAGAAGVAAAAAQAVAPGRVLADDGDPLKIGQPNSGSSTTSLTVPGAHALAVSSGGGDGVRGSSSMAGSSGVYAYSTNAAGHAFYGWNASSNTQGFLCRGDVALQGSAPTDVTHYALVALGRISFPSRSGVLTIAAGKSSVSAAESALAAGTIVLATLQTNRAGVYIQAAVASSASGKITIYLNKKVTAATKVAYFVLG